MSDDAGFDALLDRFDAELAKALPDLTAEQRASWRAATLGVLKGLRRLMEALETASNREKAPR